MHSFITTLTLALVGLGAAHPVADKPIGSSKGAQGENVVSYVAKFDDVVAAGAVAGAPVRGITPLGPYDNLFYENLGVISDNTLLAGVKAQSSPNVLAFDLVAQVQGQQKIYADYDDSITDFFNFKYLYFGCVLDSQETATSSPLGCTLITTGFRKGKQVASQSASFKASGLTTDMLRVDFKAGNPGFSNVDAVSFAVSSAGTSALTAVLIDNIGYDVHLKKGASLPSS